jgi:hypothetical protein
MYTSDYRIEKDRIAVVVTTLDGERLAGDLFVQPYTRYRMGREQAPDLLNAHEPFFPLGTDDATQLLAKDNVREVEVPADEQDDVASHPGARATEIEVVLAGGVVRTGLVLVETPSDRPRLLDFLNRLETRFLTLYSSDGVRLLNRRFIERVRPID